MNLPGVTNKALKDLRKACQDAIAAPMISQKDFDAHKPGKTPDLHRAFIEFLKEIEKEMRRRGMI